MLRASISLWVILLSVRIALSSVNYLGVGMLGTLSRTLLAMAVGEFLPLGFRVSEPRTLVHTTSKKAIPCPPLMLALETALFLAIDVDCSVQKWNLQEDRPSPRTTMLRRDAAAPRQ